MDLLILVAFLVALAVASAFGSSSSPNYVADFDVSKDGNITAGDLGLVAARFGACP